MLLTRGNIESGVCIWGGASPDRRLLSACTSLLMFLPLAKAIPRIVSELYPRATDNTMNMMGTILVMSGSLCNEEPDVTKIECHYVHCGVCGSQ